MRVVYGHCNEPSVFIIGVEFLHWPNDSHLISYLVLVSSLVIWLVGYRKFRTLSSLVDNLKRASKGRNM